MAFTRKLVILGAVVSLAGAVFLAAQHDHNAPPIPSAETPLRPALLLLRDGKTEDARKELNRLLTADPANPEIHYQIARSYLMDFYGNPDPSRGRTALALAMEALENTLRRNPDHVPALKSKAVIHARAELLYYNPNLAYDLGARIAKLQPSANEYLLNLSEWLSGEVRFTSESGHRVPHDPLTGLDRSIELLDRVIDSAMPYSNEETLGFYQMAKTLAKRGNYTEAIRYYQRALGRPNAAPFSGEILREMGASYYRDREYGEAARAFYRAVQSAPNLIDRWLLRVSLEQAKESVRLQEPFDFPVTDPQVDTASPPLLAFQDIAKELGVNRFDGNGTCAFGDYDGDRKLDLLLAGSGTFLGLYKNEGNRFRDATAEAGLSKVPSGYSLNFVDYDNDGRLDIYLALNGWNGPMKNRLFHNMGEGKFKDVSKESGAEDPGSGFVSLWGDLNNDGFLDLIVTNGVLKDGSVPQIYRNNRNGTFRNVTKEAGLNEPPTHGTIGAALGDYDRDGDIDLFLNGLQNSPNRLYRNDGNWQFTEVGKAAGVVRSGHTGYVAFFTDYNNDTWPDLLVTSLAPWEAVVPSLSRSFKVPDTRAIHSDSVRLYRNNRNGTFTDATWESRLYYPMGVMGAGVADLDNDGFVDFYFGTGDPQLSRIEPNRFFRNNGDGTFSDLTRYLGLAQPGNKGHGVCFVDIDEDGDLELYAQLGGHYPGDHAENAFYRNLKANGNNWLQLELFGTRSNRFAVGAQVVITAGDRKFYREVKGSEGFGSTNPYVQHFGLGTTTRIDTLEIRWPSGLRQTLTSVGVNRRLKIQEDLGSGF